MALMHKTQYALICVHLCSAQEQFSQQHRTSERLATIFPFMPRETLLACGIFRPHINSPHFMFENIKKRKKTPHHSITATSIHQGKQQRQGNTGRKCLYMHRNGQENQPKKRQKISKSHPALLTPHLQLQTSQHFVSTWCRCQNFVLAAIQGFLLLDRRTAGVLKAAMPCNLLCQCSAGLAANGHSPSAPGRSSSQVILFLSLRTFNFSLLLSKGFILFHTEQAPWIWSTSHQATTSLWTPIPRWQADPSLTPLNASTGKGLNT